MSRVYVGNLPVDVRERELDDVFSRYGGISSIDIKGGRYVKYSASCKSCSLTFQIPYFSSHGSVHGLMQGRHHPICVHGV